MEDTIAGVSTSLGVGAISIIRISGDKAIEIANEIFSSINLSNVPTHTIHYGHIHDKGKVIDEVLVSVMRSPKTFTTENIVEINCHGGIATTNKVLELVLNYGARLAAPGEFTKRALLNGRISLIEAEGIFDLINSKTEKARKIAINQVDGNVTKLINKLRKELLELLANIEVNIDYPEYEDVLVVTNEMIYKRMEKTKIQVHNLLKESENSKIIKEGIKTLIIGRPNVGKSSILNKLLDEEKAIVTNIAGTTRDAIEGTVNFEGILLHITDTAGVRKTDYIIEKIGVQKSIDLIDENDLIILVLNNNEIISDEDIDLIKRSEKKKTIIFINKNDLEKKTDIDLIKEYNVVEGNTLTTDGLNSLKKKIKELINLDQIEKSDFNYLTNARQISKLKEVLKVLVDIEKGLNNNEKVDMLEIDIKIIWEMLGEIIGENYSEELLDELFSQFCLGK